MGLLTILAVQLSQAAPNETGYRLFTDSHGELILDMWNVNITTVDPESGEVTHNPAFHYYISAQNWSRTTNVLDENGDPVWKEQVDMGAGYLPAGQSWDGSNMVSYWISNFTNWQFGVGTDNDHLTWASVQGSRTIQGRVFTLNKTNYLTNDSTTMLVNESLTSSGSTPIPIYALYRHYGFNFPNPIMRARINGTLTDIPLDGSVHQLYRGTDISLQDTILGEKTSNGTYPESDLGFQIRFRPMSNYSYWLFVNGTEIFEVVRLGQFNGSGRIDTRRAWNDAICTVTPGCAFIGAEIRINGSTTITNFTGKTGEDIQLSCRTRVSSPCNPSGQACYMEVLRLTNRSATPNAFEEQLFPSPRNGGAHFFQTCNDTVNYCFWYSPADSVWKDAPVAMEGNTTALQSGGLAIGFNNGFRYVCRFTHTGGSLRSGARWINTSDSEPPSLVQQVSPANDSTICGGVVTHTVNLWDAGYMKNVTFSIYNSSGQNIQNYTYNCSPWDNQWQRATWDFVTPFSEHDCVLYDMNLAPVQYPNYTVDLSTVNWPGFTNNSRYNWSANASDMGGAGNPPNNYNWALSAYNFTYLYKTFCDFASLNPEPFRDEDQDEEFVHSDNALLLAGGMLLAGCIGLILADTKGKHGENN